MLDTSSFNGRRNRVLATARSRLVRTMLNKPESAIILRISAFRLSISNRDNPLTSLKLPESAVFFTNK
ncbi:hypothetical protein D3C87_2170380 [compost metagenome]